MFTTMKGDKNAHDDATMVDIVEYDVNATYVSSFENQTFSGAIKILEKIELYYVPFLVAFGTVGNWLSVVVFFSTKLRKLSSSFYLAALAISDTGFLLIIFVSWLNMIDISIFNQPIFCELSVYLSSVCSFLSVWFVVAFTVERFIAVGYPLKRPSMCTVSRAKIVITCLTFASLLFYMPQIFISGLESHSDRATNQTILMCQLKEDYKDLYNVLDSVDFFIVLILPFFAISFINTSICLTVWKLARIRRTMTNTLQGRIVNGVVQRPPALRMPSSIRSNNSQIKVTKMLLIVSTVFICLNLPSYILRSALHFQEKKKNF
ncbi:class A rhodopsin-like G-protein coupled receptor GPRnna16, putative [Pediculus humanus corporis]|uniref:Class A rhodopsin-like G-protein coupled receptor GPRnna16, putative n=1 Tax=Pediculus humanus subsp. corporis TaxID=121224 RepID=E0VZU5_PEDHC|nr:class A rhodopsin-like G-protein coupled receptor GPRnna16, putative [Pediculus humanus corporis]EEB18901.1 class A rhodopsin-like G-protein coupled receptor GPRnna16, putative [Pediculus humanus corporis]